MIDSSRWCKIQMNLLPSIVFYFKFPKIIQFVIVAYSSKNIHVIIINNSPMVCAGLGHFVAIFYQSLLECVGFKVEDFNIIHVSILLCVTTEYYPIFFIFCQTSCMRFCGQYTDIKIEVVLIKLNGLPFGCFEIENKNITIYL